jgi:hypothetical protein
MLVVEALDFGLALAFVKDDVVLDRERIASTGVRALWEAGGAVVQGQVSHHEACELFTRDAPTHKYPREIAELGQTYDGRSRDPCQQNAALGPSRRAG